MIDPAQLDLWREKLTQGERIHRKESLQLVEELLALQKKLEEYDALIDAERIKHATEKNALMIQVREMNGTISLMAGRGNKTFGSYEQGAPAKHGSTHAWPEEVWGSPEGKTCDWGDCDKPAALARFDAHGHGWLPVCEDCGTKPL